MAQSELQQKFVKWFEAEREKGLNLFSLTLSETPDKTVDSVIEEFFAMEEAVKTGKCTHFPASF